MTDEDMQGMSFHYEDIEELRKLEEAHAKDVADFLQEEKEKALAAVCPACEGRGEVDWDNPHICQECNGLGVLL